MKIVSTGFLQRRLIALFSIVVVLGLLGSTGSLHAQAAFKATESVTVETEVGSTQYGSVVVENLTNSVLLLNFEISGADAASFGLLYNQIALDPDSIRMWKVPVSFSPMEAREYSAVLTIGSGMTKVQVPLTGKASAAKPKPLIYSGTTSFSAIRGKFFVTPIALLNQNNIGNIVVTKAELQGASQGAFTLSLDTLPFPRTLTPNLSTYLYVELNTETEGTFVDSIRITYMGVDNTTGTLVIPLYGVVYVPTWMNCVNIEGDSNAFGPLDANQVESRMYQLANYTKDPITIDSIIITGDKNFTVTPITLPYTLKENEKVPLTVSFNGGSENWKNYFYGQMNVIAESNGSRCVKSVRLYGTTVYSGNVVDTSHVSLFPNKTEKINLKTKTDRDSQTVSQLIIFQNANVKTKVIGVSLKDGSNFTASVVYPSTELPLTLEANGIMMVRVTLNSSSAGNYHDQLIVTTENGIQSSTFDIDAIVQKALAGVKGLNSANGVTLFAQPNPARGPVTLSLSGANRAKVEVYNTIGELVYSSVEGSNWTWNGRATNGEVLPTGAYIIRAVGNTNGQTFITSTRVVLSR